MSAPPDRIHLEDVVLPGRVRAPGLEIRAGECVVVCGPNGSGKSSLLRLLAGLERDYRGKISFGGDDIRSFSRREIARRVAWLPQRASLSEFMTCEAIVAAARFRFLESQERSRKEAIRVLSEQGIGHLVGRSAERVSGGELQRVLIASLVAQDTPFLLVDEPANHLDPFHQVATYERLGNLWQREGRTIVVVTHDVRLAQVLGPAERVRVLGVKQGELLPETTLADDQLPAILARLYGVAFVGAAEPGGLSVDLAGTSQSRAAPLELLKTREVRGDDRP